MSRSSIDPTITGEGLRRLIEEEAARRGESVISFAAPLSPHVESWLKQLAVAKKPKPHTIERVRALIAGEEVPEAPPNNFQKSPSGRRESANAVARGPAHSELPPRVDRTPCPRCGVRSDIGCPHSARAWPAGAFA